MKIWIFKISWTLRTVFTKVWIAFLTGCLIKMTIVLFDGTRNSFRCCETTFMPILTVLTFINNLKIKVLVRDHRTVPSIIMSIDWSTCSCEPQVIFRSLFVVDTYCPSGHGRGYFPGLQMNPVGQSAHPPLKEAPEWHISILSFEQSNPGGHPDKHSQSNSNKSLFQISCLPIITLFHVRQFKISVNLPVRKLCFRFLWNS